MPAEELVERVLAGDVEGDAVAAPPRPAPHLAQAGDRAGEGDADRGVELADVDAELERVGGDHGEQLAAGELGLDLAPLLGRVAGAVGRDPRRQPGLAVLLEPARVKRWISSIPRRLRRKQIVRAPLDDQVGEQLGGLRERRAAGHRLLVDQRRVPDRDPPLRARRAVGIDERERRPDEPLGELDGVGDRRRGADEARVRPVDARHPAQPAQDVGDVGAEDAAVGVRLVDDDPVEVGEEVAPALVVGEDRRR